MICAAQQPSATRGVFLFLSPTQRPAQAEAELLAAIVAFFRSCGLASSDVGIRVSNRKVLQAVLERFGVTADKFAPVCVVVDKMEKIPREAVEKELTELGVEPAVIDGLLQAMAMRSLEDLSALLGAESPAVKELVGLFALAKGARIHTECSPPFAEDM